jgi:hypothetical protein
MAVTYELLEQYTGTRTNEMPDPDNEGEIITEETPCRDIQVRFTCGDTDCVHERSVNVCFDAEGAYDADATDIRIGQVANGVANKIACGVITASS